MCYYFEHNKIVTSELEVERETDKSYISGRFKYPKSEIGKTILKSPTQASYIQILMIDGSKDNLKNELSKWFIEKGSQILNNEVNEWSY